MYLTPLQIFLLGFVLGIAFLIITEIVLIVAFTKVEHVELKEEETDE